MHIKVWRFRNLGVDLNCDGNLAQLFRRDLDLKFLDQDPDLHIKVCGIRKLGKFAYQGMLIWESLGKFAY